MSFTERGFESCYVCTWILYDYKIRERTGRVRNKQERTYASPNGGSSEARRKIETLYIR